jgi:DNA-binding GntR family transcriptional regulator
MMPDPLKPVTPRYLQVARSLMAEIAAGRYPVGTRLPNELQLCEQFGASRFTVRAAIGKLAGAGLVSRKPKIGTVVEAREARPQRRLDVAGLEDIQQFGRRTSMRVLTRRLEVVAPEAPPPLDQHVGETWLYVEGLRTSDQSPEPICFNQVWVCPDYRGVSGIEGVIQESIFTMVERQFGVTMAAIEQDMRASAVEGQVGNALGLKRGSPALIARRAYYDDNRRLVELAISIHPPDSFVYSLKLERHDGAGRGAREL